MRYLLGFLCVGALGMVPLVGCSDTVGDGGSGGSAGSGGMAGGGGTGGIDKPTDACLDDSGVISDNLDELLLCHATCFFRGAGASCVSECVAETGVSEDCAACYGLRAECVLDRCDDFLPPSDCFAEDFIECSADDFKECTGGVPCGGVACFGDGNECTVAVCEPPDWICRYPPVEDETACDGGIGTCQAGECVDAMKCEGIECDDGSDCTEDVCNRATGACDYAPLSDIVNPLACQLVGNCELRTCSFDATEGVCRSGVCCAGDICESALRE